MLNFFLYMYIEFGLGVKGDSEVFYSFSVVTFGTVYFKLEGGFLFAACKMNNYGFGWVKN